MVFLQLKLQNLLSIVSNWTEHIRVY